MGDGSCAFQIMRSRVHTTCTRDVCITPGHVTDKDECGLPWGTQHDMSTSKEVFPRGDGEPPSAKNAREQIRRLLARENSVPSKRENALHHAGRIRKRKGRAIASRISFGNLVSTVHEQRERKKGRGERETDTLGTFRKENASSSLPRPTLAAAWDARRKRNLRFQKPNYTLDTLFQSHCPLLRLALVRSSSLSLSLSLVLAFLSGTKTVAVSWPRGKRAANVRHSDAYRDK